MSSNYLDKRDIRGQELLNKTKRYMIDKFQQFGKLFSYSSSYGQIMLNISNHSKLVFYYIKDSINEMSFHTARRKNSIFGMAQLQGHNAHRGHGSVGSISLAIKKELLLSNKELSSILFLPNFSRIRCSENGLLYYVNLGKEYIEIDTKSSDSITLNVSQGIMRTETFVADGTDNQTFSIPINNVLIDMNHILVEVNGLRYTVVSSFSEFFYSGNYCIVRTGLTDGIDVVFGKEMYSNIPKAGETIKIYYPVIAGKMGNISSPTFVFVDSFYNLDGVQINGNKTFDITIVEPFKFGADPEETEITKILAPNVNKNRFVYDKKSVKYWFDSKGIFGEVKVFNATQANLMETYLYPKLQDIVADTKDYFSLEREDVLVDDTTKNRLLDTINNIRSQNIDVIILDPTIRSYSMLIKADVFKMDNSNTPVDLEKMKMIIRKTVSDKMITMKRTSKIAKSDVVKVIDDVQNVDSVFVEFVAEDNDMIDEIGNIVISDTELALPSDNFVNGNGDQMSFAIKIDLTYVNGNA